jgi:hypothetical protein
VLRPFLEDDVEPLLRVAIVVRDSAARPRFDSL